MFPESSAPPLPGFDDFRLAASVRGIRAQREYTPRTVTGAMAKKVSDFEHTEEEQKAGNWDIYLMKEEMRSDGKWHVFCVLVPDRIVQQPSVWEVEFNLVEMGWEAYLEGAGV
jgi:hypothetical protein